MKYALIALLLVGCAPVHYPQVGQPRMLQWGVSMPRCWVVCIAHATVTDAERGSATSTVTTTEQLSATVESERKKEEPK
jgi:hypothetical protein